MSYFILIRAYGRGTKYQNKVWSRKADLLPAQVECCNPLCINGGCWIEHSENETFQHGQKETLVSKLCQGTEGKQGRPCATMYEFKITVTEN